MYWLDSIFEVSSLEDVLKLSEIYPDVYATLELDGGFYQPIIRYKPRQSAEPFLLLYVYLLQHNEIEFPLKIHYRSSGPDAIRAIAPKLLPADRPEEGILREWADWMDKVIRNEMSRSNDLGYCPDRPKPTTAHNILLAARISHYADFAIPLDGTVVVGNYKRNGYLTCIKTSDGDPTRYPSGLVYDVDDGLVDIWESEISEKDQAMFTAWKKNNHRGSIKEYFEESLKMHFV